MALHRYFTPVTSLPTPNALYTYVRVDEDINVENFNLKAQKRKFVPPKITRFMIIIFKDRKSQGGLLVIHTNSKGIMHKNSY